MKLAVISCLHANLPALDAVLSDIDKHSVDQIFCVGDLAGYGPHPNEVIEKIRNLGIPTCAGCWDEDVVEGHNACECSYPSVLAEKRGLLAHEWTNQQINPDNKAWLATLPHSLTFENLAFVHGSPYSAHEYLLPRMSEFLALERVLNTGADILFCGHTHVPYIRSLKDAQLQVKITTPEGDPQTQSFCTPLKRIVNVGSVGEPRHGRPNATYVLYNTDLDEVTLREVPYPFQQTCMDILERGLPPIFAWRLARGLEYAEKAEDPAHICTR
jgi:diadenosine tetraphosphatase ApaH/serine/threonine PP2A family protein phosphatase